jgi:hypothetical protein
MKPLNYHGTNPALAHLGGQARRAILKSEERVRKSGEWGQWERVPENEFRHVLGVLSGWVLDVRDVYRNRVFSVLVRDDANGVIHVGVGSQSGIRPTWYEMQRIKNEIFGEHSVAIEVYPAAKDVVDGSDMFHIWILPSDIPFGLTKIRASRGAATPAGVLLLGRKPPL